MTWYRVGPAGIPGSLKTDMDAVFNKKFGTSTTYAPNTWPDNVNLLGPLPEKTASGSIAHIEDGADGVPLKNWLVTLPASLDGYTEVNAVRTGKNIVNVTFSDFNANNIISNAFSLKAGTYTLSLVYNGTPTWGIYLRDGSAINSPVLFNKYNDTSLTFILSEDKETLCITMYYANGITSSEVSDIQIEVGSAPTTYEAYAAPTQYTASLGRTIYGGTADIVNGNCEPTNWLDGISGYTVLANETAQTLIGSCEMVANVAYTLSCSMTGTPTARTRNRWAVAKSSNMWDGTAVFGSDFYTAPQQTFTPSESGIYYFFIWSQGIDVNVSYDNFQCEKGSTATAYSPYFAPFTFTPITPTPETALGVNNFWADEGDSDVTYRADISLALQALGGGGRGLMGMMMQRPEEEQLTEEDPEEVPEEAETDER